MQCVILAAGKGTRLLPLTENCHKALVKVNDVPLLDHIVSRLPDSVEELVIVTGHFEEQIHAHCGSEYFGRPVTYVHQAEQKGTGHALWLCKDVIKGRFLYMFADDLHGKEDLARVSSYTRAMLVYPTNTPERFGIVLRSPDGTLGEFIEKPEHPSSNLASTGVFVLDKHIFNYAPRVETNGELYHTDMIREYVEEYKMAVVEQKTWLPVGYPEDIDTVKKYLDNNTIEKTG